MTFKLNVTDEDSIGHSAWHNYTWQELVGKEIENNDDLNACLEQWNAKNVPLTPYIEFKSEEDATLFIIRWS